MEVSRQAVTPRPSKGTANRSSRSCPTEQALNECASVQLLSMPWQQLRHLLPSSSRGADVTLADMTTQVQAQRCEGLH